MISGVEVNTLILLVVAIVTAINTYYSRRTEKNTNGLKDALVRAEKKLSKQEGRNEVHEEYKSNQ
jgi:hypothetical protein